MNSGHSHSHGHSHTVGANERSLMKAVRAPFYLAGALLLTGCASTVYEGKYDWSEGWRKAEVVAVKTAAEMERPRFYTCVRTATPEQLASTRFAVVK